MNLPEYALSEFKFNDQPRFFSKEHYREVRNNVANRISINSDVISVYDVGKVAAPGISDIDLLVVLKDNPSKDIASSLSFSNLSNEEQYIFSHPFLIINESLFNYMNYIFPDFDASYVCGKKLKFKKVDDSITKLTVLDLINFLWPKEFLVPYLKKEIYVRSMLCRLNSVKYVIRLVSDLGFKIDERMEEYIGSINALRSKWFKVGDDRFEILIKLLKEAIYISFDIIEKLSSLFNIENNKLDYVANGYLNQYVKNWDKEKVFADTITFYKKFGQSISILPLSMSYSLLALASQKGDVSNYVKRHLIGFKHVEVSYEHKLKYRMVNEHMKFLINNKFGYGNFIRYGHYFMSVKQYIIVFFKLTAKKFIFKLHNLYSKYF